jgi:hypothetical protein
MRFLHSRRWQYASIGNAQSAVSHTSSDYTRGNGMRVLCMHKLFVVRTITSSKLFQVHVHVSILAFLITHCASHVTRVRSHRCRGNLRAKNYKIMCCFDTSTKYSKAQHTNLQTELAEGAAV